MIGSRLGFVSAGLVLLGSCTLVDKTLAEAPPVDLACTVELIVLGAGQDAGAPQFGNPEDPAWQDPSLRLTATSIAVVDHIRGERYIFDAAPQITEQLNRLDEIVPPGPANEGVSGVFLTHAHIGHYAGLMYLGREVAGTSNVPVYALPRMRDYLASNGPWSQLVELNNIALTPLEDRVQTEVTEAFSVTPYQVPHRDEFSETVGYVIETYGQSALFLPDIDSWEEWDTEHDVRFEEMVATVDFAFVDATFFDDNELPGRDMSLIPHPRVTTSMDALASYGDDVKDRVHFIHYNHTNPIRFRDSDETRQVLERGFNIAREGDRHCLADAQVK